MSRISDADTKHTNSLTSKEEPLSELAEFESHADFIYAFLKDRFKAMTIDGSSVDDETIGGVSRPVLINDPTTAPMGARDIYNAAHVQINTLRSMQNGHYNVMPNLQARIGKFYSDIHPYMLSVTASGEDTLLQAICQWITDKIGDAKAIEQYREETKNPVIMPLPQNERLAEVQEAYERFREMHEAPDIVQAVLCGCMLTILTTGIYEMVDPNPNADIDDPALLGIIIPSFVIGMAAFFAWKNRSHLAAATQNCLTHSITAVRNGMRHGWNTYINRNQHVDNVENGLPQQQQLPSTENTHLIPSRGRSSGNIN